MTTPTRPPDFDFHFANPRCPVCGELAHGTDEVLAGTAVLDIDDDDEHYARWSGWTDVCWDAAETQTDSEGRIILICRDGHTWPAQMADDPQLVLFPMGGAA